ncbi:hypothetical protein NHP190012_05090 [Helicobacter sp. NHP19-012]|uniref:NYN domain-containing protein n=1 Tax=Helicobacter gastrofelis TaxID=2849642 RepID=A0ABM7SL50_9HELI|nr:hypothetical protein [Helicobacter sp. NHP19-012]BCZ18867.1 hypothetical protein NHP190012_05090 [Helicobacter sp. NHP19-012]
MRIAVFVDWENLGRDVIHVQDSCQEFKSAFDYNKCSHVMTLIHAFLNPDEKLYRVFFYTATPLSIDGKKESKRLAGFSGYLKNHQEAFFKMKQRSDQIKKFITEISFEKFVALRLGSLQLRGVNHNGLDVIQKQVDILLGLDIACGL